MAARFFGVADEYRLPWSHDVHDRVCGRRLLEITRFERLDDRHGRRRLQLGPVVEQQQGPAPHEQGTHRQLGPDPGQDELASQLGEHLALLASAVRPTRFGCERAAQRGPPVEHHTQIV